MMNYKCMCFYCKAFPIFQPFFKIKTHEVLNLVIQNKTVFEKKHLFFLIWTTILKIGIYHNVYITTFWFNKVDIQSEKDEYIIM